MIALSLMYHLDGQLDSTAARTQNQATLNEAANNILEGGAVTIFPGGGGKETRGWFPGIGVLAANLARAPASNTVYLIPVHIQNSSNARIYSLLSSNPIARIQKRLLYRQPVQVIFERPIPLTTLIKGQSLSSKSLAAFLQNHYETLFR